MLYEVITHGLGGRDWNLRYLGRRRITSYNVCYTKLLRLIGRLEDSPGSRISVDLPAQTVTGPDGTVYGFDIGSFPKECLLKGLDEIALTLQHEEEITRYESARKTKTPWLFLDI